MSVALVIDEIEAASVMVSAAADTLEGVRLDSGSAGVFGDSALAGAAGAFSAGGHQALQAGASGALNTAAALSGAVHALIGADEQAASGARALVGQEGLR